MSVPSWPEDWSERKGGAGCVMCAALGGGDNDYWVHVTDLEHSEVHLERRTRIAGYCVVVWRYGHVAEPTELTVEGASGYWADVVAVGRAVEEVFEPAKVNYLTLGNTVPHLHTHVVPRYLDDPAPGGPLAWTQIAGDEPAADAGLQSQASDLRRRLRP